VARRYDGVRLKAQRGVDLGERMLNAARDASRDADALVLIGCDCPDLGPAEVATALEALAPATLQDQLQHEFGAEVGEDQDQRSRSGSR
jgi:glycosyltransferase A (GT-A) superfamily protein (DUF2064 family)